MGGRGGVGAAAVLATPPGATPTLATPTRVKILQSEARGLARTRGEDHQETRGKCESGHVQTLISIGNHCMI